MKTKIFTLTLFTVLTLNSYAQITFERYYPLTFPQWGNCVKQTSDNGYIITGFDATTGMYQSLYLLKVDSLGNQIWSKQLGNVPYADAGNSILQTNDGGYAILGYTSAYSTLGGYDMYLIKTNSLGDTLWTKTFGGTGYDIGNELKQTTDGGFILVGYFSSISNGLDIYLVKTDSLGNVIWTRNYGGSSDDLGQSVAQTSDGGYIIAGATNSYGAGNYDAYFIKTNAVGDTLWTKILGGTNYDIATSIIESTSGVLVYTGYTKSFSMGDADIWIGKYASNGYSLTGGITIGWIGNDYAQSIKQAIDGGFIIAGFTDSFGSGAKDVLIIKTDSSCFYDWDRNFGGTSDDQAFSIGICDDNGFVIVGQTTSFGSTGNDIYLIKTDSLGHVFPTEIVKNKNDIYCSIYPNPTFNKVFVEANNILKTEIFDLQGKYIQKVEISDSNKVIIDCSTLKQGLYFIEVITDKGVQIEKIFKE